MSRVLILCPWVKDDRGVPTLDFETNASRLGAVTFEFESSDDPRLSLTATHLRTRLSVASDPIQQLDLSPALPIQREREQWTLSLSQPALLDVVAVLALLTAQSMATSIESMYLAATTPIPQVCVGVDYPVPSLLRELTNVVVIDADASDEILTNSILEAFEPMRV
jgi:hypothetical protein